MIESIKFNSRLFELIKLEDYRPEENVFSIIVGKNGTGKSTLLSSIVSELLKEYDDRFYNSVETGLRKNNSNNELTFDIEPNNVIAVSSSPFDKFPLIRGENHVDGYSYLGLRDLSSMNFGLSYMSKIISSLMERINRNPNRWSSLSDVLDYLGYTDEISVKFSLQFSKSTLDRFIDSNDLDELIDNVKSLGKTISRRFFENQYGEIDMSKIEVLKHILFPISTNVLDFRTNKIIYLHLSANGIQITPNWYLEFEEITFLINSGLLKLKDVYLAKKAKGRASIKDSSSGQQSVVLSILGIASRITDNSIICIDEPEICLHPEWQEKYIQILINTFSKFRHCHFIIATHSPQIISKLSPSNCFVISMEDAEVSNASLFLNNSIDFQLASLFKAPGFKNEYLTRLAFTVFSKVGKNKKFDEIDIENYKILKDIYRSLDENDPVKELIDVISELYKKYA